MSRPLTPLEEKIKEYLEKFTRKEPYITNTAIRIASLMPDDLRGVNRDSLRKMLRDENKRGYANGYIAGRKYTPNNIIEEDI